MVTADGGSVGVVAASLSMPLRVRCSGGVVVDATWLGVGGVIVVAEASLSTHLRVGCGIVGDMSMGWEGEGG